MCVGCVRFRLEPFASRRGAQETRREPVCRGGPCAAWKLGFRAGDGRGGRSVHRIAQVAVAIMQTTGVSVGVVQMTGALAPSVICRNR